MIVFGIDCDLVTSSDVSDTPAFRGVSRHQRVYSILI